jgi:hypothetical protein
LSVLVLPAAIACFALVLRGAPGWRDAVLRALVLCGAALVLITEIFGSVREIRWATLMASWLAACIIGIVMAVRRRQPAPSVDRSFAGTVHALLLAGIGVILAVAGWTALLSPPNSSDAMGYLLPRVVYWAQARSPEFFPTHYFNQVMMPPFAEYAMLHTFVLSGGDRYVNLVQFFAFAGCIVAVSLIARSLGAGIRGQVLAALFCATLPTGILQASGAKNECVLALWLAALIYFLHRWLSASTFPDLICASLSLALALLTKGTAYVFAPPLLLGVAGPHLWRRRVAVLRAVPVAVACVLIINGPQYWRNCQLSGSILGYDSALGRASENVPGFKWTNDRFGVRVIVSNALRNIAEHLGGRNPSWNQSVYRTVIRIHQLIGADPNDPATTWFGESFQPPVNANHEANAADRWHLLLIAAASLAVIWFARKRERFDWLWYYAGVVLMFIAFCAVIRWQQFFTRMHLPMFVAASPLAGVVTEAVLPGAAQIVLCLFLLNNTRPYLLENWVRPLKGPRSLLKTTRDDNYFSDMLQFDPNVRTDYQRTADRVLRSGCKSIGIDNSSFHLEYPLQALLLNRDPKVRFEHIGVRNRSAAYRRESGEVCAVVCLACTGDESKFRAYAAIGAAEPIGRILLFLK